MGSKSYKDLIVWQTSIDLTTSIYEITKAFPFEEKFGLTSQMRRSVVSIASNIAEGSRRGSPKEFRNFVMTASGSGAELETQLLISRKVGLINENEYLSIQDKIEMIMKMLNGLEKNLRSKISQLSLKTTN